MNTLVDLQLLWHTLNDAKSSVRKDEGQNRRDPKLEDRWASEAVALCACFLADVVQTVIGGS